jgi:hypothetical protein
MNPNITQDQLTQIFSDLHTAQVAYAVQMQQPGQKNVRFYQMQSFQVDDMRPTPPRPEALVINGTPLYVVQTDFLS